MWKLAYVTLKVEKNQDFQRKFFEKILVTPQRCCMKKKYML